MNQITEKQVVAQKTSRRDLKTLGSNIFYLEKRPAENGRTTLIYRDQEVLAKEFDIKSKVHEYGGGAYALSAKYVMFVNKKDQQLYLMDNSFIPLKLTNYPDCRFADGVIDEVSHCSYWVCEQHNGHEVSNSLVRISHQEGAEWGSKTMIHSGQDFYAAPALHNKQLAFISWNHPNMPWDNTNLHLGQVSTQGFDFKIVQEGTWISQPQFDASGKLYFIKELAHGFSNICSLNEGSFQVELKNDSEYASPAWNFGVRTYALYNDKIIASYWENGKNTLELIHQGKSITLLPEYAGFANPQISHDNLIIDCYSFTKDSELVSLNLKTLEKTILISAKTPTFPVSIPEPVTFKSQSKKTPELSGLAHGFLYLPQSKKENLPLMVISHGGPTGMSTPFFDISIQYWVDKGFAVFDVNYRGSTGYGKDYRQALDSNWGLMDVMDCESAALYCVEKGIANKDQLIIRGSSAGGYTTMAALTFLDTFKAGASYYGICDLNMLATSTHKFESRYMDKLIAPFNSNPQEYAKRSPVNYISQINCPMIVFQGEEDRVVPKEQAETIYKNLTDKNIPCQLYMFAEEGHGFSKEENLITCMTSELAFYKKTFNL